MRYYFYIQTHTFGTNKQGLKSKIKILKLPINFPIIENGDGPYKSINELKKNSKIFIELTKTNPSLVQKILNPKNIFNGINLILTPKGQTFGMNEMNSLIHCTIGRVKNGNITGVHFYDSKKVKLVEIIKQNKNTGVFKSRFEFYDSRTKKWILKKNPSTFFPINWSVHQLFQECIFGIKNMKINDNSESKYNSTSLSGIPLEIIMVNDELKSIYPLL